MKSAMLIKAKVNQAYSYLTFEPNGILTCKSVKLIQST